MEISAIENYYIQNVNSNNNTPPQEEIQNAENISATEPGVGQNIDIIG